MKITETCSSLFLPYVVFPLPFLSDQQHRGLAACKPAYLTKAISVLHSSACPANSPAVVLHCRLGTTIRKYFFITHPTHGLARNKGMAPTPLFLFYSFIPSPSLSFLTILLKYFRIQVPC